MIYKIWASLEEQDENKDHYQDLDMPEQLGVFDTQAQAEKFLKLVVGFCDSFGSGIAVTATPPNPQHGREPNHIDNCKNCTPDTNNVHDKNCPCIAKCGCSQEPDKVKPLAQYLGEYIEHETELELIDTRSGLVSWRELLEQALDAYQSTENVTIKIERK